MKLTQTLFLATELKHMHTSSSYSVIYQKTTHCAKRVYTAHSRQTRETNNRYNCW